MILRYLKQSYPIVANRWKIILPVSLFVCLFVVIFQPFGLAGYQGSDKYLLLSGYGLVTFVVLIFDMFLIPVLFPQFFKEKNWRVWKELVFLLWILFTIGLANMVYTSLLFFYPLTLSNILTFQLFTLAIGIFPIITLTIVKQNYLHRKNRLLADELSDSITNREYRVDTGSRLLFMSDNGKDEITVNSSELLAVDAEGNYITVFYLQNGESHSSLLRNTLSYAEEVVAPYQTMFKCHRSYLVNLNRIKKVTGNSQGYNLLVHGVPIEIPVSRSNTGRLKELLANL